MRLLIPCDNLQRSPRSLAEAKVPHQPEAIQVAFKEAEELATIIFIDTMADAYLGPYVSADCVELDLKVSKPNDPSLQCYVANALFTVPNLKLVKASRDRIVGVVNADLPIAAALDQRIFLASFSWFTSRPDAVTRVLLESSFAVEGFKVRLGDIDLSFHLTTIIYILAFAGVLKPNDGTSVWVDDWWRTTDDQIRKSVIVFHHFLRCGHREKVLKKRSVWTRWRVGKTRDPCLRQSWWNRVPETHCASRLADLDTSVDGPILPQQAKKEKKAADQQDVDRILARWEQGAGCTS
ncbi:hypothetical protein C8F01DRAFT_1268034 [Mycena amicta]|nr:hypothetical protein C8F01DRAFT_1268034 [Mycena amicta]